MRALKAALAAFSLVVLLSAPVSAYDRNVDPATAEAIKDVINSQLDAFQRDDAKAAFAHASPAIQHMFGNAENFIAMVRQGYQAVYRPRYVEFSHLARVESNRFVQHVVLEGPDGVMIMAVYRMLRDRKGTWRINGVYTAKLPRQSA